MSANQARDQARPDHAPAREARTADPERNGHTTRGGEAHPLWQPVVGRLADANSKVHRAITQARPSDLGKLNAALDQAHAAGVRPLELRKLADLGTPLDDPSIKSVPATLAYRIRKHVEEHAHG